MEDKSQASSMEENILEEEKARFDRKERRDSFSSTKGSR
jgi:hypothetical protein